MNVYVYKDVESLSKGAYSTVINEVSRLTQSVVGGWLIVTEECEFILPRGTVMMVEK